MGTYLNGWIRGELEAKLLQWITHAMISKGD